MLTHEPDGATITSAEAARKAGALTLHFRREEVVDVTIVGVVEEATQRPHVRRKPVSDATRPDQPTLL